MQSRKKKHCIKKKKINWKPVKKNKPRKPSSFHHAKYEIKRILSPFNKFKTTEKSPVLRISNELSQKSTYYSPGLSVKEKSYILNCCQRNTARYLALKDYAAQAIKNHKIFTIYSPRHAIRKALTERGWVEKLSPCQMNLHKIRQGQFSPKSSVDNELERLLLSTMVEKERPTFIWAQREDQIDPKEITEHTIINKLRIGGLWTTKYGLCETTNNSCWFYIEGVAEVTVPRTYATDNTGEAGEFVHDYRITACTSLLKWVLSMVACNRPAFLDTGKIDLTVIVFALNRCKEYLMDKQNRDIDKKTTCTVTSGHWNVFLKKYYQIITENEVFETDRENIIPLYMEYAQVLLKEIDKYRPQIRCEGCHNIWILKPSHNSRGRGIRMASNLRVIAGILEKSNSKYVIQKYIEDPLLIYGTKFDIRQYYLITSTYPLVIWMYKDCYLKFSSQNYSLENYHEAIHLTNNAVQRKYNNSSQRHAGLPEENMWHLDMFKEYLIQNEHETVWDDVIYTGMKKSIVAVLLACQEQLGVSKNRFELYGCDFILDREFKPWLIEINSSPDLNPTTSVTAKICPEVLKDIVKVVIDRTHIKDAPTGKFECIYRQCTTKPRLVCSNDLYVQGRTLPNEYFYRGKMPLQGSCHDVDAVENSISTLMYEKIQKFKLQQQLRVNNVGLEPNEYDLSVKRRGGFHNFTNIGKTISDEKVGHKATAITMKQDNKLQNVGSVSRVSSNHGAEDFNTACLNEARSFMDLPEVFSYSLDKLENESSIERSSKSVCNLESNVEIEIRSTELNQVDIAPDIDHSGDDTCAGGHMNQIEQSFSSHEIKKGIKKYTPHTGSAKVIQETTTKLFDFLNKKEHEYKNSSKLI